jgi:formylglycine-generating enzyme required for sulfatase activity
MAKKPEARHASMDEFAEVLTDFLRPKVVQETPPEAPPPKGDDSLLTNSLGMKLKRIPSGEFFMGAADGEPEARPDEKPQHKVRITRPFYLGVYEVTQAEYQAVMGVNPSYFSASGGGKARVLGMDTDRFPVEMVSWLDAIAFCNKLSESEGLKPCYTANGEPIASGTGYRLPTEAEWEYACRAGTTTPFSIGSTLSPTDANFNGNGSVKGQSLQRTAFVGSYAPNAFGLHDMHGNVWEWCQDFYDEGYYARSPDADPENLTQAEDRVSRGGSWGYDAQDCRSTDRSKAKPYFRNYGLGFRIAIVR